MAQPVKNPPAMQEDLGSILGLGRSPGEGNGYPLQYSGLENSTDCTVHESQGVRHNWVAFTQGIQSSETWLFHLKICIRYFAVLLPVTVAHSSSFPYAPWHKLYILHPLTCPSFCPGHLGWFPFVVLQCCGYFLVCVSWCMWNCTVQRQKCHVGEGVNVRIGRAVPNDFPK